MCAPSQEDLCCPFLFFLSLYSPLRAQESVLQGEEGGAKGKNEEANFSPPARDLCQRLRAQMPFVSFLLGRACDHCIWGLVPGGLCAFTCCVHIWRAQSLSREIQGTPGSAPRAPEPHPGGLPGGLEGRHITHPNRQNCSGQRTSPSLSYHCPPS